jgi:hypothetical protein
MVLLDEIGRILFIAILTLDKPLCAHRIVCLHPSDSSLNLKAALIAPPHPIQLVHFFFCQILPLLFLRNFFLFFFLLGLVSCLFILSFDLDADLPVLDVLLLFDVSITPVA